MEYQCVPASSVYRNRIGEVAVALLRIKVGIGSVTDLSRWIGKRATLKVFVGMPKISVVVGDRSMLHDDTNGELSMGQAG